MDIIRQSVLDQHAIVSWALVVMIASLVYVLQQRVKWKKKYHFPPGPKGLPLFGIFFDIYDYPAHLAYTAYKEDHGPIFTASIMYRKVVVLNDVATIRDALIKCAPKVDDRSSWRYCFIELLKGLSVMPYSKKWINTRRRTVTILRRYGMGKSFMEPQICKETQALIANILRDSDEGKANITVKDRIRRVPLNVICMMLFNERYDYDDEDLLFILRTMEHLLTFLRTACTHDSLPNLLRPLMKSSLREFHANINILNKFLHSKVKYHEETYQEGVERDFLDAWITSQRDLQLKQSYPGDLADNNNKTHKNPVDFSASDALTFDEQSFSPVASVLQDVLFAGAHSTGYAMNWMLMFLTLRKDIQDQVYESIMDTVGSERTPTMNDKAKLPIVEAVIHETLRVSSLVPLVGHSCYEDVTIAGYRIPKGTEVTYNNWAINHNEENFPDSYSFLPERWIKEDGSFDRDLTTKFFPFGIGKRSCAGESLARMELFLITTTIFQNLELLMPDGFVDPEDQPEIKHIQSFVLEPKLYKLRARKRKTSSL